MPEPDTENLGAPVTWTIRDVPTAIRDAVVDATPRGAKVGETLTQIVLRGLHGADESHASDKKSNASYGPVSNADLAALVQAAATLEAAGVPVGLKRDAAAAISDRIRAARGLPPKPSRSRPKQLTDQSGEASE
jgi:hypothetical protein